MKGVNPLHDFGHKNPKGSFLDNSLHFFVAAMLGVVVSVVVLGLLGFGFVLIWEAYYPSPGRIWTSWRKGFLLLRGGLLLGLGVTVGWVGYRIVFTFTKAIRETTDEPK